MRVKARFYKLRMDSFEDELPEWIYVVDERGHTSWVESAFEFLLFRKYFDACVVKRKVWFPRFILLWRLKKKSLGNPLLWVEYIPFCNIIPDSTFFLLVLGWFWCLAHAADVWNIMLCADDRLRSIGDDGPQPPVSRQDGLVLLLHEQGLPRGGGDTLSIVSVTVTLRSTIPVCRDRFAFYFFPGAVPAFIVAPISPTLVGVRFATAVYVMWDCVVITASSTAGGMLEELHPRVRRLWWWCTCMYSIASLSILLRKMYLHIIFI